VTRPVKKKRLAKSSKAVKAKAAEKRAAKRKAAPVDETAKRHARLRWSSAVGVAAAVVVAMLVNLLAARHYRRWDWTEVGLYTLSPVTEKTLSIIDEPIEVYVLLSSTDPLTLTLRHLLDSYQAHTSKLRLSFVDPDRSPAEFIAVQQKFGIVAGKTEDGEVVTDAAIIFVKGDRRHFVTSDELLEVEAGEEARARPRVEQVLTGAIRQVRAGEPPTICFTSGYGELALEEGGNEGLFALDRRLHKLNYAASTLAPLRELPGRDPIASCRLVVVAAPTQPMPSEDVTRLVRYVEAGGNALVFAGPEPEADSESFVRVGLAPLLALAGVSSHHDIVFERDSARRAGVAQGEMFIASPQSHPVTEGFVQAEGAINIMLAVSSSLRRLKSHAVSPTPLLTTSKLAFGMTMGSFFSWAKTRSEPEPQPGDHDGPLTLAFAAELPRTKAGSSHGPRMVVVGSNGAIWGANWQNEQTRGTALFVESAISWLASEPIILDIPNKPARPIGLNITEDALDAAFLKLVLFMPAAPLLIGIAIRLRRREEKRGTPADAEKDADDSEDAADG
jgi:hypothetical protein